MRKKSIIISIFSVLGILYFTFAQQIISQQINQQGVQEIITTKGAVYKVCYKIVVYRQGINYIQCGVGINLLVFFNLTIKKIVRRSSVSSRNLIFLRGFLIKVNRAFKGRCFYERLLKNILVYNQNDDKMGVRLRNYS